MPWVQVRIYAVKAQAGRAESLLEALGARSVTLEDAADQPLLEPLPGETPIWDNTCVTGLFDAGLNSGALTKAIDDGLRGTGATIRLELLPDQAWERTWLEHFRPMRFGRRLWVCPRDQAIPVSQQAGAVVITLDPGLAFGTGSHATTALCLEWLDSADLRHKKVIDYGCGSGILAIAAALLGAVSVAAIDHDPQALLATRENAATNGIADSLEVTGDQAIRGGPADVVLANILASTLIDLADPILKLVKPGGELVLSGILAEQTGAVAAAYEPFVRFAAPAERDGWILLAGTRQLPGHRQAQ